LIEEALSAKVWVTVRTAGGHDLDRRFAAEEAASELLVGDPLAESTSHGPIANRPQFERVQTLIHVRCAALSSPPAQSALSRLTQIYAIAER
jgi:hypothetical protein